jgi:hypothetical protein
MGCAPPSVPLTSVAPANRTNQAKSSHSTSGSANSLSQPQPAEWQSDPRPESPPLPGSGSITFQSGQGSVSCQTGRSYSTAGSSYDIPDGFDHADHMLSVPAAPRSTDSSIGAGSRASNKPSKERRETLGVDWELPLQVEGKPLPPSGERHLQQQQQQPLAPLSAPTQPRLGIGLSGSWEKSSTPHQQRSFSSSMPFREPSPLLAFLAEEPSHLTRDFPSNAWIEPEHIQTCGSESREAGDSDEDGAASANGSGDLYRPSASGGFVCSERPPNFWMRVKMLQEEYETF